MSDFDDSISVGDKIKVKHMSATHENGIVGDTLYVYEGDKRESIEDKEGTLQTNNITTDGKTLKKNKKLNVIQIEENTKITRISGKTKNRDILKSQREKDDGVNIGSVDIRGTNIKNVKTYRRNNQYIVEE
jgi:hypothetical protein